jgi:putative MFS transporter
VGLLITLSPEFGKALGLADAPDAGKAVALCYIGLAIGDLASGLISQWLRSRRRAVGGFIAFQVLATAFYFLVGGSSLQVFYLACFVLGLSGGYWALFVTIGAEQFGTNIRATVTTTVPNFVRGAVPLMTTAFLWLKGQGLAVPSAGLAVGAGVLGLALWGLAGLDETFAKDLDYVEHT